MTAEVVTAAGSATSIDSADGGDLLTVWVGAPLTAGTLPATGLLLVVEADLERARQLKDELQGRQDTVVCAEVLAPESGSPVRWCRFNDPRFNGPLTAADWQERYPNLRQLGEEQRSGRSLEDVLEAWAARQGLQQQPLLRLELHQGDPLAALEGLGSWLTRLEVVQLSQRQGLVAGSAEAVAAWLEERGLRATAAAAASWQRDPIATQALLLRERDQQIAELEEQLATQAVRLLLAQTRHKELQAERHQLQTERDALVAGRQELTAQRDVFLAERDQLKSERDQGLARIGELEAHQDGLSAHRDQLQAERDTLGTDRDQIIAERDTLRLHADSLQQRLDQINSELDEIILLLDQSDALNPVNHDEDPASSVPAQAP